MRAGLNTRFIVAIAGALLLGGCALSTSAQPASTTASVTPGPVDRLATRETRALFGNPRALAQRQVMFGHQETLAYGVHWQDQPNRSDIKDVTGSFPAVQGWDLGWLFARGRPDQHDPLRAERLRRLIAQGHAQGAVITLSWHMPNPVTDTNSWDTTAAVPSIIPGGKLHADYQSKLDIVAAFIASLRAADGSAIPVIFRPFHEHTGDWFWWGRAHATTDEFKSLWRFTVSYLRDRKGIHNALYGYSTDVFDSEEAYLERYPGDDVIDLLGFDDYHSVKTSVTHCTFVKRLRTVAKLASERGKIAALTETGVEAVPQSDWWTKVLLPALSKSKGISYALVWRNANRTTDRKDHYYAPFAGQASAADFVNFKRDPLILFADELPNLYRENIVREDRRSSGTSATAPCPLS